MKRLWNYRELSWKTLFCLPFKAFYSLLRSLSCVVTVISTFALVTLIGLGIFLLVNASMLSLKSQETERLRLFTKMGSHLAKVMVDVKYCCSLLEGLQRQFVEWQYFGTEQGGFPNVDLDRIVSVFTPYYRYFSTILGTEKVSFGMWIYKDEATYSNYFFDHGKYFYTNTSHFIELDFPYPIPDDHFTRFDPSRTLWKIKSVAPYIVYDQSVYIAYAKKHKLYDYWIGDLGRGQIPFLSFSIGSGPLPTSHYPKNNYSTNPWLGMEISSFSTFLKSITPKDTVSWLVELGRDYMLASSDADTATDLMDPKANGGWGAFLRPSQYGKKRVRDITEAVLKEIKRRGKDEWLGLDRSASEGGTADGSDGGSGAVRELIVGNERVMFQYLNQSRYGGEWIFFNTKKSADLYRDSITFIVVLSVIFGVVVATILTCAGAVACRLFIDSRRLVKEMREARNMRLEGIGVSYERGMGCGAAQVKQCEGRANLGFDRVLRVILGCGLCSGFRGFSEVEYIENQFLMMVEKLREFRAFLPSHIVGVTGEKEDLDHNMKQPEWMDGSNSDDSNCSYSGTGSRSNSSSASNTPSKDSYSSRSEGSMSDSFENSQGEMSIGSARSSNVLASPSKTRHLERKLQIFSLSMIQRRILVMLLVYFPSNLFFCPHSEQQKGKSVTDKALREKFFSAMLCDGRKSNVVYQFSFGKVLITFLNEHSLRRAMNHILKMKKAFVELFESLEENTGGNKTPKKKKKKRKRKIVTENEDKKKNKRETRGRDGPRKKKMVRARARFFLHKGVGYTGNLGTTTMKQYCMSGPVKELLHRMPELVPSYVEVSASSVCVDGVGGLRLGFESRMLYSKAKENDNWTFYEMGRSLRVARDEWMYELKNMADLERWKGFNEGVRAYFDQRYEEAMEKFDKFQNTCSDDLVVKKWIRALKDESVMVMEKKQSREEEKEEEDKEERSEVAVKIEGVLANRDSRV